MRGFYVRYERTAEVRDCHNNQGPGLTLESNNQPGADQQSCSENFDYGRDNCKAFYKKALADRTLQMITI